MPISLLSPDMPCAVILTAIPVEFKAVRVHLTDLQEKVHPEGTVYEIGEFLSDGRSWQVAIAEIGTGGVDAAVETKRAIDYFKPEVLLFVGVAGGIKDVKLGDVVAATKVYGYESGKVIEEAFLPRPNVGLVSYGLEQRAKAEARKEDWLKRIKDPVPQLSPQAFVGALAAGEKVVASTKSEVYQLLRYSFSDALAVEMESHGVLKAVRANPEINALIVRGISDLIDKKGEADAAGNQEIAARHASAFVFEVLAKLDLKTTSVFESLIEILRQEDDIFGKAKKAYRDCLPETWSYPEANTLDEIWLDLEEVSEEAILQFVARLVAEPKVSGKIRWELRKWGESNAKSFGLDRTAFKELCDDFYRLKLLRRPSTVFLTSLGVAALVMFFRFLGLLQPLELPAYDLLMRWKMTGNSGMDPRILIVSIEDEDLREKETEISDRRLLELLTKLKKGKPRLIGLDIFRDKPFPYLCSRDKPRQEDCETWAKGQSNYQDLIAHLKLEDNIITICKVGNDIGSNPPSKELLQERRLSFADIIFDGNPPGVIRRHLLTMEPDYMSPCKAGESFSYQIAFHYLKKEKKENNLEKIVDRHLLVEPYVGGYQGIGPFSVDLRGRQILLNWRNARLGKPFKRITLRKIMSNETDPPDLVKLVENRVVLVGYTVYKPDRPDYHNTPLEPTMPGVVLQAHKVSQLLSAVLVENRPLIQVWPWQFEDLCIAIWSLICRGVMVWKMRWRSLQSLRIRLLITLAVLMSGCWLAFNLGWWLPLVPSVLVLILNFGIVMIEKFSMPTLPFINIGTGDS